MKKIIDLTGHPRQSHFEYFNSLAFPYMGLTVNVDVTNAIRFAKEQGFCTNIGKTFTLGADNYPIR